jgi:hypothetical protein
VDEVPGLGVLGPNFEDLLDRLKVLAGNLFRAHGETVADIEIVRSEKPVVTRFPLNALLQPAALPWRPNDIRPDKHRRGCRTDNAGAVLPRSEARAKHIKE